MNIKTIVFFANIILLTSCNTLPKSKNLKQGNVSLELGVIGERKKEIQKTDYDVFGIPNYHNKIKVSAKVKSFNKNTYKKYLKSIQNTSLKDNIRYIDSIPLKPDFVELEITDNTSIVSIINEGDLAIFNYLKKHPNASLVSKIRVILNSSDLNTMKKADALYLETIGEKQQYLVLFKENQLLEKLNLYGLHTFEYDISYFCWEVTDKRRIRLATIVDHKNCSGDRERNPDDLIEKIDKSIFKF